VPFTASCRPISSTRAVGVEHPEAGGIGVPARIQFVYVAPRSLLHQIAAYFLSMAAKMFPVIEVDAGRGVDVILTRGVNLKRANEANALATTASANN